MENKDIILEYYSKMLLIRFFEEKIDQLFSRNLLPGTAHLCIGQEAVAVGSMAASRQGDIAVSTHRGHGHLLAKGADPKRLFCEIMGKEPGYCKGLGGTQHLCDMENNFLGTNGITGGGIPIATGVGLALKLQKREDAVFSFFGDGAANQGTFHESLNMASIWKLPVVYICENNLYAMSTPQQESMNIKDIAQRASAYNIQSEIVDGMDVFKVKEAVTLAADACRRGEGPFLVEAKTYRYCGHSKSDPCVYRPKDELDAWKKRDPLFVLESLLIEDAPARKKLDSLKEEIIRTVDEAADFAIAAPFADASVVCFDEDI